jgi:hypothetical protein
MKIMKPKITLKNLLAVSLLLISILTGCKKDPVPQVPKEIFTWDYSKKSADASKIKPDSTIKDANNNGQER